MSQEKIREERQRIADDLNKAISEFKTATKVYDDALADSNRRTDELHKKCKHSNVFPHHLNCPDCGKRVTHEVSGPYF